MWAKTRMCRDTRAARGCKRRRLSHVPTRTCGAEAEDTGPWRQKRPEVPAQAQRVPWAFAQECASLHIQRCSRMFLDTHPTTRSEVLALGQVGAGISSKGPLFATCYQLPDIRAGVDGPRTHSWDCRGHKMQMRQTYPMGGRRGPRHVSVATREFSVGASGSPEGTFESLMPGSHPQRL